MKARTLALALGLAFAPACAQPRAAEVHVTLAIRSEPEPRTHTGSYVLRLGDDRFRLELGRVMVVGTRSDSGAWLTAWHEHDPGSAFVDQGPDLATLIRRDLPPVWCGVLADWLARRPDAYPLVGHDWPWPPVTEAATDQSTTLRAGAVEYHRLRTGEPGPVESESIHLARESAEELLEIRYLPIDPGDPSGWTIDPASRRLVSAIAALAAQPTLVLPGQPIVALRLYGPDNRVWDMRQAFAREPSAQGQRHAAAVVLGLFVLTPREGRAQGLAPPSERVGMLSDLRTLVATRAAERGTARPYFIARPVAVFDVPTFDRGQLEQVRGAAEGLGPDPLLSELEASIPGVFWTQPPRESIDLVCPGAQAALVIIDAERRLVAAIRVDQGEAEALEAAAAVLLGLNQGPPGRGGG